MGKESKKMSTDLNEQVEQIGETHVAFKELLSIVGNLPPDLMEVCKKESRKMIDLAPKRFAKVFSSLVLVDMIGAEEDGFTIGKLAMNRNPKSKSIDELVTTMLEVHAQVMCIVIPASIAVAMGYVVVDFEENEIPEGKLDRTLVVVDGQTRYSSILQIRKEHPDKSVEGLYAYFPLYWIQLSKMLQAINLKVFTWNNSDFITGVLANEKIDNSTKKVLESIQELESKGYNYTAACEWITLQKGIVRKKPLVDAMDSTTPMLVFDYAEFGMDIHKNAEKKFTGNNVAILKNKMLIELIIGGWEKICKELSPKEATACIIAFLKNLSDDEVVELTNPSKYKRGCGKKKEDLVKVQFDKSFKQFLKAHPYSEFKITC